MMMGERTTVDLERPRSDSLIEAAAAQLGEVGIEQPLLEAQLLLAHAAHSLRHDVLCASVQPLSHEIRAFEELIDARCRQRIPLAYLRGSQAFYGLDFVVNQAVLIPRPETELLVDFAIERLMSRRAATIIDVGTGSGCVAVAIAENLPQARVIGSDVSVDALGVAAQNAGRHWSRNSVGFVRSNLLSAIRAQCAEMIVSNPPYIPSADIRMLQPEVRDHEPLAALDGGADGLRFQKKLIPDAQRVLRSGGWLAVEVAIGQAAQVTELMAQAGFIDVIVRKDLAGIERMVAGRRR